MPISWPKVKRVFKIIGGLLALLFVSVTLGIWWLWRADAMDVPDLPGTLTSGSLEHGGLVRAWQAYLPASRRERMPVVVLLHGSRGDGQRMLEGTRYGFNILAEREGFVAVYPDGFENHWNDCRAGADYSANTGNVDDVGFFAALLEVLEREYGIDPSHVYAVGMSNGGQMAFRLGLEAPHLVAGIAAIAASLPVEDNLDCMPRGQPVRTLVINGTEDPVNPYGGGVVEIYGNTSRGPVRSSEDTARYWARLAGHDGAGQQHDWPQHAPDDSTSVMSRTWSAPGQPNVALITIVGGGHTIPHSRYSMPRILGRTSQEFDTAELVWAFFTGGEFPPQ